MKLMHYRIREKEIKSRAMENYKHLKKIV